MVLTVHIWHTSKTRGLASCHWFNKENVCLKHPIPIVITIFILHFQCCFCTCQSVSVYVCTCNEVVYFLSNLSLVHRWFFKTIVCFGLTLFCLFIHLPSIMLIISGLTVYAQQFQLLIVWHPYCWSISWHYKETASICNVLINYGYSAYSFLCSCLLEITYHFIPIIF